MADRIRPSAVTHAREYRPFVDAKDPQFLPLVNGSFLAFHFAVLAP